MVQNSNSPKRNKAGCKILVNNGVLCSVGNDPEFFDDGIIDRSVKEGDQELSLINFISNAGKISAQNKPLSLLLPTVNSGR